MIDRDGLERAVLGGIILAPDVMHDLEDVLDGICFTGNRLVIWQAVIALHRQGDPVDILGLVDELSLRTDSEGIENAITKLCEAGAGLGHVRGHARRLRALSTLHNVERTADELIDMAKGAKPEEEEVAAILDEAMGRLYRLADRETTPGAKTLEEDLEIAFEAFETRRQSDSHITGLTTGMFALDEMLGGLKPSQLTIMAGRPAMGKSAWALTLAMHAARSSMHESGKPAKVAFLSLEMSTQQLIVRMISGEAQIDGMSLVRGSYQQEEAGQIMEAIQRLKGMPLIIDDTPNLTVQRIRGKMRRLKASQGLDLLIIDYLQLMSGERRSESRQVEVSNISRGLKMLAKELDIPVVALSQLSRETEKNDGSRPKLSNLRESGSLEQDADVVMFLYRGCVYSDKCGENDAEIIVAKNREGGIGSVEVRFYPLYTKFTTVENAVIEKIEALPPPELLKVESVTVMDKDKEFGWA